MTIYVVDVPEFQALLDDARRRRDCRVRRLDSTYVAIESEQPLEFSRRALGMKPAIWYGLFTGGLDGTIERFDRDVVRVVPR
jgi:hypothetical protein